MCRALSQVITRGRTEPYWLDGENSHAAIRKHYKISDIGPDYPSLPIEWIPIGCLTDEKAWEFTVDINDALPGWFTERREDYERESRLVLEKIVREIRTTGKYGGSLDLCETKVENLGNLTSVGGSLYLRETKITREMAMRVVNDGGVII